MFDDKRQPHKNFKGNDPSRGNRTDLIYPDEVYALVGAAMEVHTRLGCGFLEAVYQEALEIELTARGIPYTSQKEIVIAYKGTPLKKTYVADLVAYGKIIVELKALDSLTGREEAQLINYLKATGMEVGVLLNFGGRKLDWFRRANSPEKQGST